MSLIATRVQNWRVNAPQFDKNMTRPCEYGALDFFVMQTEGGRSFVTPELTQRALNSMGKTLQIPVVNYDGDVTVSNARTCVIADDENTSALYTVAFATYSVGFTMVPNLYQNNDITYQHDFERKMEKVTRALAGALDTAAVAALAANKSQVYKDILEYQLTGNVIKTSWDNRMEVMGDIDPIMRANDYPGLLHIIGNAGIDSVTRKMAQLGANNAVNKVLEYAGKAFHYTNNIANESGVYGTAYAVEDGQVGYLTRAGRANIAGTRANFHEWDIVRMPILNIPVDTHYYTSVGDQSEIAGESSADLNCDVKEHFAFMVDVAFLVSYNSSPSTIANPILAFDIASPIGNRAAIPVNIVNTENTPIPVEVKENVFVPTVTTGLATDLAATTATVEANEVVSEGSYPVTERGIVYSTSETPTTSDTKVTDASTGAGLFDSDLTGLTAETTYYIRAYAINANGTSYGDQISITTPAA